MSPDRLTTLVLEFGTGGDPTPAPTAARRAVGSLLMGNGVPSDDCLLVVSEVVTNAVLHGGGADTFRAQFTAPDIVRIEVSDRNLELPRRVAPDPLGGGRGIHLVEALTDAWGVELRHGTKTVWCEVRVEPGTRMHGEMGSGGAASR